MIRLTDEQWERIRNHFPEENIGDGAEVTVNPGVHIGNTVNPGATVRGAVERGIPGSDLGTWRSPSEEVHRTRKRSKAAATKQHR